jgi:hypothetical protein
MVPIMRPVRSLLRMTRRMRRHQRKKLLLRMVNDLLKVMKYHLESKNLACIMNKIWNGNADTRLVNALASLN